MTTSGIERKVSTERRVSLLRALPSFETLDSGVLTEVAEALKEAVYVAGTAIVEESQIGDKMYLIEQGTVRVSARGATGDVVLGEMGEGEIFGEIALLSDTKRRRATVNALGDVVVLTLDITDFERISSAFPEVRVDLACAADALMYARLHALMLAKQRATP